MLKFELFGAYKNSYHLIIIIQVFTAVKFSWVGRNPAGSYESPWQSGFYPNRIWLLCIGRIRACTRPRRWWSWGIIETTHRTWYIILFIYNKPIIQDFTTDWSEWSRNVCSARWALSEYSKNVQIFVLE